MAPSQREADLRRPLNSQNPCPHPAPFQSQRTKPPQIRTLASHRSTNTLSFPTQGFLQIHRQKELANEKIFKWLDGVAASGGPPFGHGALMDEEAARKEKLEEMGRAESGKYDSDTDNEVKARGQKENCDRDRKVVLREEGNLKGESTFRRNIVTEEEDEEMTTEEYWNWVTGK